MRRPFETAVLQPGPQRRKDWRSCRRLLPALACLIGSSCSSGQSLAPLPPGGIHVLFVGNSLTYVNDLPATVAAIATSAGDTRSSSSRRGRRPRAHRSSRRRIERGRPVEARWMELRRAVAGPDARRRVPGFAHPLDQAVRSAHPRRGREDRAVHDLAGLDAPESVRRSASLVSGSGSCGGRCLSSRRRSVAIGMGRRSYARVVRRRRVSSVADRNVSGRADHLRANHGTRRAHASVARVRGRTRIQPPQHHHLGPSACGARRQFEVFRDERSDGREEWRSRRST